MRDDRRCILIVDDEIKIVRALKDYFKANDFIVLEANDGESALEVFYRRSAEIDIIILDVMMPKLNGFEVLADLRSNQVLTPIVMVTAKGQEYDQLEGFSSGADDYVTKPFSPAVLLARIEAVLKRSGKSKEQELIQGDIHVSLAKRTVTRGVEELEFTKREMDLLVYFMQHESMIFTRDQLLNGVWGYEFDGDVRTVDTHVKQLRTKLGESGTYIKTVHRVGYKFEVQNENID
ncbi:MAG: response regulator transcription factor [Lachnospiraceae bacterium]